MCSLRKPSHPWPVTLGMVKKEVCSRKWSRLWPRNLLVCPVRSQIQTSCPNQIWHTCEVCKWETIAWSLKRLMWYGLLKWDVTLFYAPSGEVTFQSTNQPIAESQNHVRHISMEKASWVFSNHRCDMLAQPPRTNPLLLVAPRDTVSSLVSSCWYRYYSGSSIVSGSCWEQSRYWCQSSIASFVFFALESWLSSERQEAIATMLFPAMVTTAKTSNK